MCSVSVMNGIFYMRIILNITSTNLVPGVQKLDSAIQRRNLHPVDSAISLPNTYPLDSNLSGG